MEQIKKFTIVPETGDGRREPGGDYPSQKVAFKHKSMSAGYSDQVEAMYT